VAAAAAALLPISASAKCFRDSDKFGGTTLVFCAAGGLFQGGTLGMGTNGLDPFPTARIAADGTVQFGIRLLWRGPEWAFIRRGAQLVFLTDKGERIELVTELGSNTATTDVDVVPGYGTMVREEAVFFVPEEAFRQLAASETLEYAVYAGTGRIERKIGPSATKFFRELLVEVD
jgi:hypothetical protein